MARKLIAALAALAFPSVALADKPIAVTPNGATETVWPLGLDATIARIASRCMDARWSVVDQQRFQVTCEAPLSVGQSILGQLALGNSYSTPPRRYLRFSVVEIEGRSRVQAGGWIEVTMAFGQVRRTDLSGASFHNNMMGFMVSAGGQLPPGTTFPNHIFLGVDGGFTRDGYVVREVVAGSPAEQAGIQPGDVITRLANKRVGNDEQYFDASARASESATYRVEIRRGGRSTRLEVARAFRPAVPIEITPPVRIPDTSVPPPTPSSNSGVSTGPLP